MNFTIDKTIYSAALDKVKKALSKEEGKEYYNFIKHEVNEKHLHLLATDGNIQIEYYVNVGEFLTVYENGISCPHGQILSNLIKGFLDGPISIYTSSELIDSDKKVEQFHMSTIKQQSRSSIHCVPCGVDVHFPIDNFKFGAEKIVLHVDAESFITLLKRTQYSVAKNLTKPAYANVSIDICNGTISACGTDGQRMSYSGIDKNPSNDQGGFLIYAPNIKEFLPLLDEINQITISDDKRVLCIQQSQMRFSCRQMVDIEYPNWRNKKLGFKHTVEANVKREDFIGALKNIMNTTDYSCKLEFVSKDQTVSIIAQPSRAGGDNREVIWANVNTDITFSVVPRYIFDALSASKSEIIKMLIADEKAPFKMILDENYECIISPINE